MTLWDLNQYIETRLPWWAPLAASALVLAAFAFYRWVDKH